MMMRNLFQVLLAFSCLIGACRDSEQLMSIAASQEPATASAYPRFSGGQLLLDDAEFKAHLQLSPVVKIDGRWLASQPGQDCVQDRLSLRCPILDYGFMHILRDGERHRLQFLATRPLSLEAMGLQGTLLMPQAQGWLSHGFQSWSQTGVISLKPAASPGALDQALAQTGEAEVYRRGSELSWWYSFIGSDRFSMLAGASTANHLRSYLQFAKLKDDHYSVLMISGAGEQIRLQADELREESWFLAMGPDLQQHMDRYANTLESRRKAKPTAPLFGWNSWYNLWDDVREADVVHHTEHSAAFWQSRSTADSAAHTLTLDDGWQKSWGDWYPNAKFPSGIEGLAKTLAKKSQRLGLWLAPLLADPQSQLAKDHPDWLIPDAYYENPMGKKMRVLDITRAAVAEHLQATIQRLIGYGVQEIKIDFLFAGTLEGQRWQTVTGMEAYHRALQLIREAAGEDVQIFAVGAPPLATLAYVDGWRVGGDIAFKPAAFGFPKLGSNFISNQARSLAGRTAYCQVTLCDADPGLLRDLPQDQVHAGVWIAAAAGGAMVLSDDLTKLEAKRRSWSYDSLQVKNGLSAAPARLQSYFPTDIPDELNNVKDKAFSSNAKVPEVWILPDGSRIALHFGRGKKWIEGVEVPPNGSRILPACGAEAADNRTC